MHMLIAQSISRVEHDDVDICWKYTDRVLAPDECPRKHSDETGVYAFVPHLAARMMCLLAAHNKLEQYLPSRSNLCYTKESGRKELPRLR